MNMTSDVAVDQAKIKLAKMCLALIRNIAARGVSSEDPAHVGYALQEISQVLFERTGTQERRFESVPADQITGLEALHKELDFLDSLSHDIADSEQVGNGFWA
jgi:hypothetical protein